MVSAKASVRHPTQTQYTMGGALDVSLQTDDGKFMYCNKHEKTNDNTCLHENTNEAAKLDLSEIGKSSSC